MIVVGILGYLGESIACFENCLNVPCQAKPTPCYIEEGVRGWGRGWGRERK